MKKCSCGSIRFENFRTQNEGDAFDGTYAECVTCKSTAFWPLGRESKKFETALALVGYAILFFIVSGCSTVGDFVNVRPLTSCYIPDAPKQSRAQMRAESAECSASAQTPYAHVACMTSKGYHVEKCYQDTGEPSSGVPLQFAGE